MIVDSDPPLRPHYWMSQEGRAEALGGESRCYVSCCLWPAIDGNKTSLLLGLDKPSLWIVTGFITGHCEIRSLTRIWNRCQPDYCNVRCDAD